MKQHRALAILLTLALPAQAQVANKALCEPPVIEIQNELLSPAQWMEVEQKGAAIPNGTGRLWQITSPRGAVSHLWGTMHSADPRISNPPKELRSLIAEASIVMLEYVASNISQADAEAQIAIPNYMIEDPHTLMDGLPPEAAIGVEQRLAQLDMAPEDAPFMDESFLFLTMLGHPCGDRLAVAGFPIQDTRIEILAADAGADLISLDPPTMITTFAYRPRWQRSFQSTLTLFALWQLEQASTSTFYAYYQTGRVGQMMAFEETYFTQLFPNVDIPAISATADTFLLDQRNKDMVKRALPYLDDGGVVMAAGTYHLPGETGLVELLREEGFGVERVMVAGEAQ